MAGSFGGLLFPSPSSSIPPPISRWIFHSPTHSKSEIGFDSKRRALWRKIRGTHFFFFLHNCAFLPPPPQLCPFQQLCPLLVYMLTSQYMHTTVYNFSLSSSILLAFFARLLSCPAARAPSSFISKPPPQVNRHKGETVYGMGEGELAYFEEAPGRGGRGVNQGSGERESQRSDRWHALTARPPHSQGIHCLARHANNTA